MRCVCIQYLSLPFSTTCLPTRLDEPDPFVDVARNLRQDGSRIGIHQLSRLAAGIACMSAEVGERCRKGIDVAVAHGVHKRIPVKRRTPGDGVRRSLSRAAKLYDVQGNLVRVPLHLPGNLVE